MSSRENTFCFLLRGCRKGHPVFWVCSAPGLSLGWSVWCDRVTSDPSEALRTQPLPSDRVWNFIQVCGKLVLFQDPVSGKFPFAAYDSWRDVRKSSEGLLASLFLLLPCGRAEITTVNYHVQIDMGSELGSSCPCYRWALYLPSHLSHPGFVFGHAVFCVLAPDL